MPNRLDFVAGAPRCGQARGGRGAGERPLQGVRAWPRDSRTPTSRCCSWRPGRRVRPTTRELIARDVPGRGRPGAASARARGGAAAATGRRPRSARSPRLLATARVRFGRGGRHRGRGTDAADSACGSAIVALLMYTSGTTAQPKGCLLTHEALVRHGDHRAANEVPCGRGRSLLGSAAAVPHRRDRPDARLPRDRRDLRPRRALRSRSSLHQLEDERITVAYPAFEPIWLAVLDHPRYAESDLSSICASSRTSRRPSGCATCSGACRGRDPGLLVRRDRVLEQPDPRDRGRSAMESGSRPSAPSSRAVEIKIVDPETGAERAARRGRRALPPRLPRFEGYYKDPEQTAQAIDADGWFHTGDLGSIDADGRLRYSGRLKDMLKVGGENVVALEIEDYLVRHPRGQDRPGRRRAGRSLRRGAGCVHRARPGAHADRGRDHRVLRRPDRDVQGAALRPLRDRVADVGDEDPEVRPHGRIWRPSSTRAGSPRRRASIRSAKPSPSALS